MEDEPTRAPRKMRFKPKAPPRKAPKATEPKIETVPDTEDEKTKELLRRVNEGRGPRYVEKKATPVEVAFGGASASTTIRSYGRSDSSSGSLSKPQAFVSDDIPFDDPTPDVSDKKKVKKYVEPWDYNAYYPTTLPLRRPNSGNPKILDELEFSKAADSEYDETKINSAKELGLMEENEKPSLLFLQLPPLPPIKKAEEKKKDDCVRKLLNLRELPAGFMGKMLVYKSGAIKLKLGDILFDVSSGSDESSYGVAVNTEEKQWCELGKIDKRAVITLDVDPLLPD